MASMVERVTEWAGGLEPEAVRQLAAAPIVVEEGARRKVAPYLRERGFRRVAVASDARTREIAGRLLEEEASSLGIDCRPVVIAPDPQGDVIADEASIVQLLLEIQAGRCEAIVAAGAGTIHDIARYAAYTVGIPFISVPTAPSVDGFNSKGAPLILRGHKTTIAAIGPDALFADLRLLAQAPRAMIAAGFGDMLGKYTSLLDWRFGVAEAGEPYLEAACRITERALSTCIEQVGLIERAEPEGVRILIEALIASGLAMLLLGQSHSASGSEHHLSHYWEMDFMKSGRRQVLHGAKVGVACAEIADLYHRLASEADVGGLPFVKEPERLLADIAALPHADQIRGWLRSVGGPASPDELGIEPALLQSSLREAHHIRPQRYTLLRAYNEYGML